MSTSASEPVIEAIRNRRTVRNFTGDEVPDSVLREIIEAATWAPNHRMTEPWRFYVLRRSGEARRRAAEMVFEWTRENTPNRNQAAASAEAARAEMLQTPGIIFVYSLAGGSAEIDEENYAATACAVQNLMLAAHAKGLGVGWSTGKPTRHPEIGGLLGAEPGSRIVGCLHVGYPRQVPSTSRQQVGDVAKWL